MHSKKNSKHKSDFVTLFKTSLSNNKGYIKYESLYGCKSTYL